MRLPTARVNQGISKRWILLSGVAVLAGQTGGCSGGESGAGPSGRVATTITIQAGDAQIAAAGASVPVAPTVLVRDQDGRPVSGVAVSFTVDSGGGTVLNPTATTATDGIATAGRWTLGLGRNKLRAAAGSLTPVVFLATATGELTVADSTIGTAGGELKVNKPGHPLDGFALRVRPGAFNEPVALSARYGDSSGVPSIPGFRVMSPPITLGITGPGAVSGFPIELEFRARVPAGQLPVVLLFDRATGARDALMTVQLDSTRVLALSQHLDSDLLPPPRGATSAARALAASSFPAAVQAVLGAVTVQDLSQDLDTGFRPGVDDWEFDHTVLSVLPTTRHAPGLPLSAAWYFEQLKGARGPLNKRYQRSAGVEWSNPMGFRMALAASNLINLNAVAFYNQSLRAIAGLLQNMTADSLVLLQAKAQLFLTGRPQIVFAVDDTKLGQIPPLALLAYRTHNSVMETTQGTSLSGTNAPASLALVNRQFAAPTWTVKDPLGIGSNEIYQPNVIWAGGQNTGVSARAMRQLWQDFDNGTVAAADFPKLEVVTSDDRKVVDTLFVADDSTWAWIECATCSSGLAPGPRITPVGKVQAGAAYVESGGTWTRLGSVKGNGIIATESDTGKRVGFLLAEVGPSGSSSYNGWQQLVIAAKRLTVTASPVRAEGATDVLLKATYARPRPSNARWKWALGDGRTLTTNTDTVTVRYPFPPVRTPYGRTVKVRLESGTNLEATGSTAVTIEQRLAPAWVFTSVSVAFTEGGVDNTWFDAGFIPWSADTARALRIQTGAAQGGLIYFPRDTVLSGSLKSRGLYMLEGGNITKSTLLTQLDVRVPRQVTLSPAPGRIAANMVVMPSGLVSNTGELPETYVEAADFGAPGSNMTSLTWTQYYGPVPPLPYNPQAIRVHDLALTLSDSTATGALITYTRAMTTSSLVRTEKWRRTMTVTFSARRIQ